MIEIVELQSLTQAQALDVKALMGELSPGIEISPDELIRVAEAPGTHFFAAVDAEGRIVGCASLCVFVSPTGRKASVEDVVVRSACRGEHIGRRLMERLIGYAREKLAPVDLHLTSRPQRVAANNLYRSLGFRQRETNVYLLAIE